MKNIFTSLLIFGTVSIIGGLTSVAQAQESTTPVVRGGAKYFRNLGVGNVNQTSGGLTGDSQQVQFNGTLKVNTLGDINANGIPRYIYNNEGIVVLPLGEKQTGIPYHNQGDASLQTTIRSNIRRGVK